MGKEKEIGMNLSGGLAGIQREQDLGVGKCQDQGSFTQKCYTPTCAKHCLL
jgi:hypothetical protein